MNSKLRSWPSQAAHSIVQFWLSISLVLICAGSAAWAQDQLRTEQTEVRLVSDSDSVQTRGTVEVGVFFKMIPEWHVYWENPGDSGLPPKFTWHVPAGVEVGEIRWPVPERIKVGP